MKVYRCQLISCCISLSLCGAFPFSNFARAQREQINDAEQALEIAQDDPRVKDILADFPEIRMVPSYSERFDVWIIEFLLGDREAGMASVSLEQGAVVEFNFKTEEIIEQREHEDEREEVLSIESFFRWIRPRFEGPAFCWLSLVLVFVFLGNFSRLLSLRNLDIILLYSLCPFLLVLWQDKSFAYAGIFAVTLLFFLRCLLGARRKTKQALKDNAHLQKAAVFVLVLACLLHVQSVYEKPIDDSGLCSVIGAEYMIQTGRLPYGTDCGHIGVYGPLLYVLHVPANRIFQPDINFDPQRGTFEWGPYEEFEMRGAQTVVLVFDLLAMLGLYCFGRKYGDKTTGVLLALVFALCPYVIGIGGAGGLQWTSHIVGIAFVVFALVLIDRPVVAGLMLGLGSGTLYYPAVLFVLWLGYYVRTSGWREGLKFLVAFAAVGLACIVMILILVVPGGESEGHSPLGAFINDTVYFQQFSDSYGRSPFSFWGQYPEIAKWGKPIVGASYLLFCLLIGFVPRRMNMRRLVALTAAVLVGTQFTLAHGGGTYIGFYIAAFIILLFGPSEYPEPETAQVRS
ncbi:MAG: hypothetical protein PVJ86_04925 [Phycisphaerales bacterium]|jgi:hypothetical protein